MSGFFTFQDAFEVALAYMGASPSTQTMRDARSAVDEALRDLVNRHLWSHLLREGRLNLNAPFKSGTLGCQVSSGSVPYLVTFAFDGTDVLPTWASGGSLYIGAVVYEVDRVLSPTTLTLLPPLVPSVDIEPGTSYTLYQDTYVLPADFTAQDQSLYQSVFGYLNYVSARQWLWSHQYILNLGIPRQYTITGHVKYPGRLVARFAPLPYETRTLAFIYKRRPRPVVWQSVTQGTVAVTAGSNTAVGFGTAWDPTMGSTQPGNWGSVLRVGPTKAIPGGMAGGNLALIEGLIREVQSPQQLTLLDPSPVTVSGNGYCISDYVDIEVGSMQSAMMRCIEYKVSQQRNMKDKADRFAAYMEELATARDADSRSFAGRAEGDRSWYGVAMKDAPLDLYPESNYT